MWRVVAGGYELVTEKLRLATVLRHIAQHQSRVFRSEAYAVADGVLDRSFTAGGGDVVQIAVRIRPVEIDGGRNLASLHCDQSSGQAGCPTRALSVTNLRLQA